MAALLQNMNYALAFTCCVLAVHLFRAQPVKRTASMLLGANFLMLAVQASLMSIVMQLGRDSTAALLIPCLALCFGPLFYLNFKAAARADYTLRYADVWHFLPAVWVLLQRIVDVYWIDIDFTILLSFLLYTLLLLNIGVSGEQRFRHHGAHSRAVYRWLIGATVIMALAFLTELLVLIELSIGRTLNESPTLLVAAALKLLVVGVILLNALHRRSLFEWVYRMGANARTEDPEFAVRLAAISTTFDELVEKQRLFTQNAVSLASVAKQIGVPARQLSQAINHTHGVSFSKHMNRLRVTEAKRQLSERRDKPITQIMFDAGFRTKSNFNKEFLAIEGVSPTQFREALGP